MQAESHSSEFEVSKFKGKSSHLSFLPINYPQLHKWYVAQRDVYWTPSEINMSKDRNDWRKLTPEERYTVGKQFALFSQFDGLVCMNLSNFKKETSALYKEAGFFYAIQDAIETIHGDQYSIIVFSVIDDEEERNQLLDSIKYDPFINEIAAWAQKYMDSEISLLERIIAFACNECCAFQTAFPVIYYVKNKNLMPGTTKANEWIARDEGIHTKFAIALYLVITLVDKIYESLAQFKVHKIISDFVSIFDKFIESSFKKDFPSMSCQDLKNYLRCTADTLSTSLGYEKIYGCENTLEWMAIISLPNKSNFFETEVSEYAKASEQNFEFNLFALEINGMHII